MFQSRGSTPPRSRCTQFGTLVVVPTAFGSGVAVTSGLYLAADLPYEVACGIAKHLDSQDLDSQDQATLVEFIIQNSRPPGYSEHEEA